MPVAVLKKYGDDRGGSLAALLTFYGFLAVFPLLLLLVTIAGIVLGSHSQARERLIHSALAEFPVIGDKLGASITALQRATPLAFVVSAIGLLWGSLGVTNYLQQASATMWDVPRHREPGLVKRVLADCCCSARSPPRSSGARCWPGSRPSGVAPRPPGGLLGLFARWHRVVNLGAYLLALHILAPAGTRWRTLVPGTVIGGLGWTALVLLGGLLVSHALRHATQLYGFFATVLGLVFWLSLGSQLFIYAGEANVVLARRLWPRHLDDPPHSVRERAN